MGIIQLDLHSRKSLATPIPKPSDGEKSILTRMLNSIMDPKN